MTTTPFRLPLFLLKINCASCLAKKLRDKCIIMEALGFLTKFVVQYSTVLARCGTETKQELIQLAWNALWKYMFLSDCRKSWVKSIPSFETLKQSLKLLDFRASRLNWSFVCTRRACFHQIWLYKLISAQHLALCIWDHLWVIRGIIHKISNSIAHTNRDSGMWFHRNYMAI